jgi:regulator of protease activity HflC (stomatin/prohibitin superfamily)
VFYVQDPTTQVWNQTPFRGLGKETQESLANDPLHEPITGEVAVVVEWYLMGRDDISISNFINNVAPEGGRSREEEVRKRIEDMAAKTLQELLGPTTLGHAQVMLPHFNLLIKEALESLVGEDGKGERPWGIHIANAYIKSFNPGITVNKARADAVAAGSKKRSDILAGEAQAERARLQAAAEAYSEIQKGMGEAGRISEMAKVMTDDNARFIATLDVAERVLPKASFIVIPSDLGVIGSILKLGQQESKK